MAGFDWSATTMGAVADWPASLRAAVDLALALPAPAALLWDDDLVVIPNAAFAGLSVARGTSPLGRTAARTWPRGWPGGVPLLQRVRSGEAATLTADDGDWTFNPVRDESGDVRGILVTVAVSSRDRTRDAALFELQRQSRNALAFARSLARRTAETSRNLEDYVLHLDGRIDAFSRARSAIAMQPNGVDLASLLSAELLAAAALQGDAASVDGPDVLLPPRAAEIVALVMHELAMNAVKFGALAVPGGRIAIVWQLADTGRLMLDWRESGVPGPLAIEHRGFGLEVIESTLPFELGAETAFALEAGGAHCTIVLPLADLPAFAA